MLRRVSLRVTDNVLVLIDELQKYYKTKIIPMKNKVVKRKWTQELQYELKKDIGNLQNEFNTEKKLK